MSLTMVPGEAVEALFVVHIRLLGAAMRASEMFDVDVVRANCWLLGGAMVRSGVMAEVLFSSYRWLLCVTTMVSREAVDVFPIAGLRLLSARIRASMMSEALITSFDSGLLGGAVMRSGVMAEVFLSPDGRLLCVPAMVPGEVTDVVVFSFCNQIHQSVSFFF